jgi:hypothetical protein
MKNKKKKSYCAFIDFAKAFDTVWRKSLWHKLLGFDLIRYTIQATYIPFFKKLLEII